MKDNGCGEAAVVVVESAERCLSVLCAQLEEPQDVCVAFWGVGSVVLACSDGAKLGAVAEAMPAGVSVLGTTAAHPQHPFVFRVAQDGGQWRVAGAQDKDGRDVAVHRAASVPWERLVVAFVPRGCALEEACDSSAMLVRVGKSALVPLARKGGEEWSLDVACEAAHTPVSETAELTGCLEHVRVVSVELLPLLTRVSNVKRASGVSLCAEQGMVCLVDSSAPAASVACVVANHATQRTRLARQLAEVPGLSSVGRFVLRTVRLAQLDVVLEVVEPSGVVAAAAQTALVRAQAVLQRSLGLRADVPLLHAQYQPPFTLQHLEQPCAPTVAPHLVDVHLAVPPPNSLAETAGEVAGAAHQGALCVRVVRGSVAFYHYGQDGVDDSGWGCAYRSLQTLCSWLVLQGATAQPVPTHRAIQQLLVDAGDKPRRLVGSHEWIGAVEVALCLQRLCGVECRVLHVASGRDVAAHAEELGRHFEAEGTPVMVGGDAMAYTLLGVAWHPHAPAATRFLVLDPHYTGADTPAAVVARGGCAWRPASMFEPRAFYNFCLPLRPRIP